MDPNKPSSAPPPKLPVLDLFSLKGEVSLVTGTTRGIGRACAIALAQAGSDVVLVQRPVSPSSPPEGYFGTRDVIRALGRRCEIVECDLRDLERVKTVVDAAISAMNDGRGIDVVVNCHGIQRRAPAVDFLESDWDEVIDVNLKSVWLLCQAAGRHMVPKRKGKIINISSLMVYQGGITVPAYTASKGAVGQLTKALSNEWSQHNVQANCIAPGYIKTDMNEALLHNPERLQQISARIPANRWGEPEDFAGPVVFLASKASGYISGEGLLVDGGWMGR